MHAQSYLNSTQLANGDQYWANTQPPQQYVPIQYQHDGCRPAVTNDGELHSQGCANDPQHLRTYNHQPYYCTIAGNGANGEPCALRTQPIQRPPPMVYSTPPTGSLGTPQIGSSMWARTPQGHPPRRSNNSCGSGGGGGRSNNRVSLSSTPGSNSPAGKHFTNEELDQIALVPTRPLLKALAKQCKPNAPWYVGCAPGATLHLAEEIALFSSFVHATPAERAMNEAARVLMLEVFDAVWPGTLLLPMAATAAGQPQTKVATIHVYAEPSTDNGDATKAQISEAVIARGGNVEFGFDDRGTPCALCVDSRSGKRFCVRYGGAAAAAAASAQILAASIAGVPTRQATFCALLALLEQNKILDDSGVHNGLLGGEAIAVMLLAVVNSYGPDDEPDSGRLLLDFFMTFGFQTNFDFVTSSVTIEGMRQPLPKIHENSQLDVIDPGNQQVNLTSGLDRAANLQAVFNYCYTALSQYQQISTKQRRAQSTLSTIIGGEPYWGRVLLLYQEAVEPFYSAVEAKKAILALNL